MYATVNNLPINSYFSESVHQSPQKANRRSAIEENSPRGSISYSQHPDTKHQPLHTLTLASIVPKESLQILSPL